MLRWRLLNNISEKMQEREENMKWLRYLVQAGFVAFSAYLGLRHQIVGGGPGGAGPIDAFCPYGAFEALPVLLLEGSFVSKTAVSNLWILGALVTGLILVGPVFCGWICPLGSLGEWLYGLRRRVSKVKWEPSATLARQLTWGRAVVFVLVLFMSWQTKSIWFENIDPYKAIFHMNVENATTAAIIGGFVLLSLAVERAWCRWLCPLGIFNSLVGKVSLFKIRRNEGTCIHCNACSRACPTRIPVAEVAIVDDDRCVGCQRCVEVCPVKDTLQIKAPATLGHRLIKPAVAGLLAVFLFVGIVGGAQVSGYWASNDLKGKLVSDITSIRDLKGWMKWSEVVDRFKVNEAALAQELKLPPGYNRNATLKELGHKNGFETKDVGKAIDKLMKK